MHTFRKLVKGNDDNADEYVWEVGYYVIRPSIGIGPVNSEWNPIEDFTDEKSAAAYVNYLNGGNAVVDVCIIPV